MNKHGNLIRASTVYATITSMRPGQHELEYATALTPDGRRKATLGHGILAAAATLALSCLPVAAESPPACMSDAVIVFDASGSMAATDFADGATSRIDRARQSLATILPRMPSERRVGLVTYGPGKDPDACKDASLRLTPRPNFAKPIMSEVDRLRPDGRTPLTSGVKLALDALRQSHGGTVVLLTDGQETCRGDPCALAHQTRLARPDVVIHVIGYKLDRRGGSPASGAECLAQETHGVNLTADTASELTAALQQTLGCQTVASATRGSAMGAHD